MSFSISYTIRVQETRGFMWCTALLYRATALFYLTYVPHKHTLIQELTAHGPRCLRIDVVTDKNSIYSGREQVASPPHYLLTSRWRLVKVLLSCPDPHEGAGCTTGETAEEAAKSKETKYGGTCRSIFKLHSLDLLFTRRRLLECPGSDFRGHYLTVLGDIPSTCSLLA